MTSANAHLLSVVIPVYRNAGTIIPLFDRIDRVLTSAAIPFEVVYVNDGCPGGSGVVLEELRRLHSNVKVLSIDHGGQHRAVMAGIRCATGDSLVILDADLQDPPEAIPALLRELNRGFGVVFAGRRGRYESLSRLISSRLFKRILHWVTGLPSDAGMFFIMRRQVADQILALSEPDPFVIAMIGCTGVTASSIPVQRSRHTASAYTTGMRFGAAYRGLRIALRWRLGTALNSSAPNSR